MGEENNDDEEADDYDDEEFEEYEEEEQVYPSDMESALNNVRRLAKQHQSKFVEIFYPHLTASLALSHLSMIWHPYSMKSNIVLLMRQEMNFWINLTMKKSLIKEHTHSHIK